MVSHDATPRRHVVRAVCEGLACGLRANLEQLQAAIASPLQSLILGGGLARSASFGQTLSEVLGVPIVASQSAQETARGAALCAGVGAGVWPSLEAAAQAAGAPRVELTPDAARAAASQSVYANWRQIKQVRAEAEVLASQLVTPWVMAANDRLAVVSKQALRPKILICADLDEAGLRALRELGDVEYASYRDKMRMLSGPSMVAAAADFGCRFCFLRFLVRFFVFRCGGHRCDDGAYDIFVCKVAAIVASHREDLSWIRRHK